MNSNQVLLIDPHQLSREGFKLLLAGGSYDVVGATRSLDEARVAIELGLDMSAVALTQSLRLVMLGQQVFPALPSGDGPNHGSRDFGQTAERSGLNRALSGREGEILCKLLHGHSNKMIARELNISEATVKVHLKALLRKLKARNRTQAAIWAMENGYATRGTGVPHSFAGTAA